MQNFVSLTGRLGSDPEMKTTATGKNVVTISMAVSRNFKNKQTGQYDTDWLNVILWNGNANFACTYCHKGDLVQVEATLRPRKYVAKDGTTRHVIDIVANNIYRLTGKKNSDSETVEIVEESSDIPEIVELTEEDGDVQDVFDF